MGNNLKFRWPETGKLSIRMKGNESATLRFTPSARAVLEGLRKVTSEPAYEDLRDGHPHTHEDEKEAL